MKFRTKEQKKAWRKIVSLLRKVQEKILEEPKQFQMADWFIEQHKNKRFKNHELPATIPNCGTAACIGGWAMAIAIKKNPKEAHEQQVGAWGDPVYYLGFEKLVDAARLADVDDVAEMCEKLIYEHEWPSEFRREYEHYTKTRQWKKRALCAVARIDLFIASQGAQ